jgi:membrane-associated phospholipid phosphatase
MKYLFYDWLGYNQLLFEYLNHISNLWLFPYFFGFISKPFKLFAFLLYYALIVLYKFYRLKGANFSYNQYVKTFDELVKIGSIYASIGLLYAACKYGINLPRPYCSLDTFSSVMDFSGVRCSSSFPSAHTAISLLIAYIFWPYLKTVGKLFSCILVMLVGMSRISLAMHFPADIVYSIIISFIIFYVVAKLLKNLSLQSRLVVPIRECLYKMLLKIFVH